MDEQRIREIVREEIEAAGLRPKMPKEAVNKLIDQINRAGKDGKHVIVRPSLIAQPARKSRSLPSCVLLRPASLPWGRVHAS